MQHGLTTCLGKKISRQLPTEHILRLDFNVCQESDPTKWLLWIPDWITSGPWKFYCYFKWMLLVKGMLEWIVASVLSSLFNCWPWLQRGCGGWKWKPLSHVQLFATPWTRPWNSPGQNTGVGSHCFPRGSSQCRGWTQVSNCRWILYQLCHQGSPDYTKKTGIYGLNAIEKSSYWLNLDWLGLHQMYRLNP